MPPTHIILTIRGRKPWRRSQFDGKTNLPRRYREKTASSMTQRDILEALGDPSLEWADVWHNKPLVDLYDVFKHYEPCLSPNPLSKCASVRSLWKSELQIRVFLSNPPAGFEEREDIENWSMEKYLYLAVYSIINNCHAFPVFNDNSGYTKPKIRIALALLMKIKSICKGKSMSDVIVKGPTAGLAHLKELLSMVDSEERIENWVNSLESSYAIGDAEYGFPDGP